MARYIALLNWTDQGIRNIKESPKRLDAAKELAKKLKGEVIDFYMTMGAYDIVIVFEAPDDEAVAKFTLMSGMGGNIRTTTMKAFSEGDYRRIVGSL